MISERSGHHGRQRAKEVDSSIVLAFFFPPFCSVENGSTHFLGRSFLLGQPFLEIISQALPTLICRKL